MNRVLCDSRLFVLVLAVALVAPLASAQPVVVNGAAGEDVDGLSPFETLAAAVTYSLTNSETEIEIQTNGPIAGAQIVLATMPVPLTIRAGAGYIPSITSNLSIIPSNPEQQVTLEGLHVELPNGFDCAAWIGCNLTANNCSFTNVPGGGGYHAALTACTGGPATDSTITLNNCYLRAHNALQVGRSVRDYIVNDCTFVGQPSDLAAFYSVAVVHNLNWAQDWSVRLDAGQGLATIDEPRTLTMNRCVLRGGTILGWPMTTLPTSPYIEDETNTVGALTATNCVFLYGDAIKVGHPGLPQPNALSASFRHCTWRSNDNYDQWGAMILQDIPNDGIEIWNCLFDQPTAIYCIGTASPDLNITGDGNIYNVPDGEELVDVSQPWAGAPDHWPSVGAAFELTKYNYTGISHGDAGIIGDTTGHLNYWAGIAIGEAVSLTPPVTDDIDGESRPLPAGAAAGDVGADEYDEGSVAGTEAWADYR